MKHSEYYRHARPQWLIQQEEIERYARKRRRYRLIRQGLEYGSYITFTVVFVIFVLWALQESI